MGKVTKTVEVTVCDICGEETLRGYKCMVCGRDVCEKCNAVEDLSYKANWLVLCPECAKKMSLGEFIDLVLSKDEGRGRASEG